MVLDAALVERIAAALHDRSRTHADDARFADLPDDEREKSRDGAREMPALLGRLGFDVVHARAGDGSRLSPDERERAAVLEHARWAAHTRELGYVHGPVRDDRSLRHPDLVPWEELEEATRDKDRVRVDLFLELLPELGLGLRRT